MPVDASSVTPAELAAAAPGARLWFQLYWSSDRGFTADLLASVVEAGFEAVVFTVDFPAAGRRERDLRAAFTLPEDLVTPNIPGPLRRRDFHAALGEIVDPTLTWHDLEWLREACPLPVLLKGILTAEDALLARRARGRRRDRLEPRRPPARRSRRRSTRCPRWSKPSAMTSRCCSTAAFAAAPTS